MNWWTAPPENTKSCVAAIRPWAFMSNSPRSGGHLLASVRRGYESAARSRQNAGKRLARVELRPIWRDGPRSERHHVWARLLADVGIVLLFAEFYVRFLKHS